MSATSPAMIVKQTLGWSIGLSILMILAGFLAIVAPLAVGIAINALIAWLLIVSGASHVGYAWHNRHKGGFLWDLMVGVLYGVVGVFLLMHPLAALVSLTLLLAIYLFAKGVLELISWFQLRPLPGSSWLLFNGIVTLILGIMLWRTWPMSSEWVIGTLVGINMLFSGVTRLMLSMAARSVVTRLA